MKAKEGSRYFGERTRLETVVPLDTPYLLMVDPSSACNIKCTFCPCGAAHSDLWSEEKKKSIGVMKFDLYKKIIDECSGFKNKIKTLRLYKEGEPLLNPNFAKMVAYAKDSGHILRVDTTTNGILLNPKLNREIVEAGLDRINISILGLSAEEYEQVCGKRIDFDIFKKNIKDLYDHKGNCHIFIKIVLDRTDEEKMLERRAQFYELFGNICDEIAVEYIAPVWPGFGGGEEAIGDVGIYGQKTRDCMVCPRIFYTLVVNSDGAVPLCFADWSRKMVIGDVVNHTLPEAWKMLDTYRIEHLKGNRRKIVGCDECVQLEVGIIDNIDDYKDELLQKMKINK